MKAISDRDFDKFVLRMAKELNFIQDGDVASWSCDHDPLFPKTTQVLREDLKYIPARIAFVIKSCQEAGIKCDCDLMFNLDKI